MEITSYYPESNTRPNFAWEVAVSLFTAAAPLVAGYGGLTAQSGLMVLGSLIVLLLPPRISWGWVTHALLLGLMGVVGTAFLPAYFFSQPEWRQILEQDYNIILPTTHTPQIFVSAEGVLTFLFHLGWAYYLASYPWSAEARQRVLGIVCVCWGVAVSVAIAFYGSQYSFSGWAAYPHFGFFPNRNQTGNLLALAGLISLAFCVDRFRSGYWSGYGWAILVLVYTAGLVINASRAGLALFLIGALVWLCWVGHRWLSQTRTAIVFSGLILLLAAFFLWGGPALERFQTTSLTQISHADQTRWLIQQDAWRASWENSWNGAGAGNFSALFALQRETSIQENRALHPESDWLWLAYDAGWLAVVLVGLLLVIWLWECFPFESRTDRPLRIACFVASMLFLGHGLVDVSAHRWGTLWPALLLGALALHPHAGRQPSRVIPVLARVVAVIFLTVGGYGFFSTRVDVVWPTSGSVLRWEKEYRQFFAEKNFATAANVASLALEARPLDWEWYYRRAAALAFSSTDPREAQRDFRRARYLEPFSSELAFREGEIWSRRIPDLALNAWQEALRRAPQKAIFYFDQMTQKTADQSALRNRLRELAQTNINLRLQWWSRTNTEEFSQEWQRWIAEDPELKQLNAEQQQRFFVIWISRGHADEVQAYLERYPHLQKAAWLWLAQRARDAQQIERACQLLAQYAPIPEISAPVVADDLESLEMAFILNPHDLVKGLALYQAQLAAGKNEAALETLETFNQTMTVPHEVHLWRAKLLTNLGRYAEAWPIWNDYFTGIK